MKIIKNEQLIRRNGKIGQWSSISGLVVLGGGMYISIQRPEYIAYSLAALLLGFLLTQVSMYYGNRFGRSPRPDEKLDAGLKGLPGDFTIYHYTTPASHLLVGPAGLWVLLPYQQRGEVSFRNNRWRLRGGGFLQNYLRIFGQEGLGRPDLEAASQIAALGKFLSGQDQAGQLPEIGALMVFTDPKVELNSEGAGLLALRSKQIKDFMRQRARERPISHLQRAQIEGLLAER